MALCTVKHLLLLSVYILQTSAATHSLQYRHTAVTSGINFTEFTLVGLVDGQQIIHYDSKIRKMIPKTEWMEKVTDDDPHYWIRETQNVQEHEENLKVFLTAVMQRFNQTGGVHTVQRTYGCELDHDKTKRGYEQYGYDGEDVLTLDLNTLTWTAANDTAVIMKQKWKHLDEAARRKTYLMNECIDWLNKYVNYGRSTPERKGGGSVGVIIGAVVAVLLLVVIGCIGFFIWKKKLMMMQMMKFAFNYVQGRIR